VKPVEKCAICGDSITDDLLELSYCPYCLTTYHFKCIKKHLFRESQCPECGKTATLLTFGHGEPRKLKLPSTFEKEKEAEKFDEVDALLAGEPAKPRESPSKERLPQEPLSKEPEVMPEREAEEFEEVLEEEEWEEETDRSRWIAIALIIILFAAIFAVGAWYFLKTPSTSEPASSGEIIFEKISSLFSQSSSKETISKGVYLNLTPKNSLHQKFFITDESDIKHEYEYWEERHDDLTFFRVEKPSEDVVVVRNGDGLFIKATGGYSKIQPYGDENIAYLHSLMPFWKYSSFTDDSSWKSEWILQEKADFLGRKCIKLDFAPFFFEDLTGVEVTQSEILIDKESGATLEAVLEWTENGKTHSLHYEVVFFEYNTDLPDTLFQTPTHFNTSGVM